MEEDDAKLVFETSKGVEPIMSFDEMGIKDDLLRGIYNYGFEKPSAVSCQNDKSQLTTLTLRLRVSSKIRQSPSAAPPCPDPTTRGQGCFAQSQSDYKEPYSDSSCPQIRAGVQLSTSSPQVAANSKRGSDKPLFLSH